MPTQSCSLFCRTALLCLCGLLLALGGIAAAQDAAIPQPALAACATFKVASRDTVPAGTGLAVSSDGRWFAEFIHTTRGAEVKLLPRDGGQEHRALLEPPMLPAGVTWRVTDVVFSPHGDLLVVQSIGSIWVLDVESGKPLYQIATDAAKQLYPGKYSITGSQLVVIFWPPESYLAEAITKNPVEVRFYEAVTGKLHHSIPLNLDSSDPWTDLELSPDGSRLLVLLRPTHWRAFREPKSRLALYEAATGKQLWQTKVYAEDIAWSEDGATVFALGHRLHWMNPANGSHVRDSKTKIGSSEYQKLRISSASNAAVGRFSRFNTWRRTINLEDQRQALLLIWRMDNGEPLCQTELPNTREVDAWLTSRGELVALEEIFELRPPLRLLRSAQVVTYTLPKK